MSGDARPSDVRDAMRAGIRDLSGLWWALLLLGTVWTLFGMFVLSYRAGTVTVVAVLAGVAFIFGGITQLALATWAPGWRWLFVVVGVLSIVAGIVAFVWPDITLYVISLFVAWYLIIFGVMHVLNALAGAKVPWWWTQLLLGIAEFVLGVWAVRSWERSLLTLLTLVGIWAIFHGVNQIFAGFALRDVAKSAERALR